MLNVKKTLTKILTSMFGKTLYDSTKIASGSLALSDAYTNYDYLVVSYNTNVDRFTKVFDCGVIAANPSHSFGGDITIYSSGAWLSSNCYFKPTDSTHLSISNTGNNANFIAGIVKVVGIKIPSLGGVIRTLKNAISNLYREGVAVC